MLQGREEKRDLYFRYWDTPNQPPAELHSQTWSVVTFLGDDRERQPTPLAMDFNRHDVHSKTGPVQHTTWVTGQRSMTMRRQQILLHLCSHKRPLACINIASWLLFRVSCSIAPVPWSSSIWARLYNVVVISFFTLHCYTSCTSLLCTLFCVGVVVSTQGRSLL